MLLSSLGRALKPMGCFGFPGRRPLSVAVDIPTRHSLKQPPRICLDPVELKEETQRLLETPIGKLYASKATATTGREEAYDFAYDSIQRAEYLQFGHSSLIPGSLYATESLADASAADLDTSTMKMLVQRMQKEGEMFMQLRHEKLMLSATKEPNTFMRGSNSESAFNTDEEGYLESSESSESDSSSSSSSDDDSDDDLAPKRRVDKSSMDFAPPGATVRMQDALLDAMACLGQSTPMSYFQVVSDVLEANDLDKGNNPFVLPTHVTYNAALRGIATCDVSSSEQIRDEAISTAFTLYNHLTHSLHLPRNTMTIIYMLQIIDNVIPASRVKGNMSVTFWDHATRLGVVDDDVIAAIKKVHEPSNGAEFDILLETVSGKLPQKYRRFIHKYRHSDNY